MPYKSENHARRRREACASLWGLASILCPFFTLQMQSSAANATLASRASRTRLLATIESVRGPRSADPKRWYLWSTIEIAAGTHSESPPMNLADLRREYAHKTLDEADVQPDPIRQFQLWMSEAIESELPEPTAMTLATVGQSGRPSARVVLLKGCDPGGFVFFTNYLSRKGEEIAGNAWVSIVFLWKELERQVRIEGRIGKVPPAESDAYFDSRPLGSRHGAWASPQSAEIPDCEWLQSRRRAAAQH